jgi:hypothetical protein
MYISLVQSGIINLNAHVKLSQKTESSENTYVIQDSFPNLDFGKGEKKTLN